jgi:predicted permease
MMMEGFIQDMRLALRRLIRTPGFAVVAVTVLALGIGANTALFTALKSALLSKPPYPDPDRIVLVDMTLVMQAGMPEDTMPWSYPKFEMGRAELASFESLAGYNGMTVTLTGVGNAGRISAEYVTPAYFQILGVAPAAGRFFSPEEEAPSEAAIAVLSHDLWTDRFGADPEVIGRSISLNGKSIEVVGVAERGFEGVSGDVELWMPVATLSTMMGPRRLQAAWAHWLRAVGRLRPETTLAQARDEARALGAVLTEAYPDPYGDAEHGVALVPLLEARVNPDTRAAVTAVSAAALLFLLIACGSVASLLLARASSRRVDVAVRAALGAGRPRLVREHLFESMILAVVGGGLGLALALGGQSLVRTAVRYALDTSGSRGLQYLDPDAMQIGPGTLAAGISVALLTGLIFGLVPAWTASRTSPGSELRGSSALSARSRRGDVGRSALVAVQLALTVVLLVGAGLMAASFARLSEVETGYSHANVLTLRYDRGPGDSDEQQHLFMAQLLDRIRGLAGVESVSAATCAPLSGRCEIVGLRQLDDAPPNDFSDMPSVLAYSATDDYVETIGAALVAGRFFEPNDATGPPVLVISETAAREFFPTEASPLGHRISITHALTADEMATVVGVVADVRYDGLEEELMPAVYLSEHQAAMGYGTLHVRVAGDLYGTVDAIRREAVALDPDLPLFSISTLADAEAAATARTRIIFSLFMAFALSGLLIGAVGLYGIVSHTVSSRTPEVGLRIALGAARGGVVRLVVGRPAAIALIGTAVGLGATYGLTRYMEQLLYGTRASDPRVFIAAASVLLAVTAIAAWIPARRATRIPPTVALRAD